MSDRNSSNPTAPGAMDDDVQKRIKANKKKKKSQLDQLDEAWSRGRNNADPTYSRKKRVVHGD